MYKHLAALLLILVLSGNSFEAFSQEKAVIIGLVRDAKTKEPLPGVNVVMGTTGTITNLAGKYELKTDTSELTLEFRFIGYETQVKKLTL